MPVMETIPNHVMMMTGLRPDRTGVPSNTIYDRKLGAVRDPRPAVRHPLRDADRPAQPARPLDRHRAQQDLPVRRVRRPAPPTAGSRSRRSRSPSTLPTCSPSRPRWRCTSEFDPSLMFVNLGDIDRFGHADLTGTTLQVARRLALADTDLQVQRFVDALKASGAWEHAVVIVLADHSMDWSTPGQRDQPGRAARGRPAARRQRADRRQRRRRPPLLDRSCRGSGRQPSTGCARSPAPRTACSPPTPARPTGCGSARRPATSWCSARPAGGSATPTRSPPTRSPATTATRPPARSRSSWPADTPPYPGEGVVPGGPHRRRRPHAGRVLRRRRPGGRVRRPQRPLGVTSPDLGISQVRTVE